MPDRRSGNSKDYIKKEEIYISSLKIILAKIDTSRLPHMTGVVAKILNISGKELISFLNSHKDLYDKKLRRNFIISQLLFPKEIMEDSSLYKSAMELKLLIGVSLRRTCKLCTTADISKILGIPIKTLLSAENEILTHQVSTVKETVIQLMQSAKMSDYDVLNVISLSDEEKKAYKIKEITEDDILYNNITVHSSPSELIYQCKQMLILGILTVSKAYNLSYTEFKELGESVLSKDENSPQIDIDELYKELELGKTIENNIVGG